MLVLVVRLALHLFGFQAVRSWLVKMGSHKTSDYHTPNAQQTARIIWAVNTASDYLLSQKPCLTKALVAQMLLAQRAYPTTLRIGVKRTTDGRLYAHAWLEKDGGVVIGQLPNLESFTPLSSLETTKL